MPIYEYRCKKCACRFELKQSFSDSPVATCPQCQDNAERIFSPVPIIFKGPGFYVTDTANTERKRSSDRRDGDSTTKVEGKTESPKESKGKTESPKESKGKTESPKDSKEKAAS